MPLGGKDGLCDVKIGATPKTKNSEFWGGDNVWATISDMKHRYISETGRKITEEGVENSSVKLLPRGTVLISFKLSIGKVAIAGKDIYTNEAIAGLIPKDGRILSEYLYHLIPYIDLSSYMQRTPKGKTLNKRALEKIRIPVPLLQEQREFIDKMNEFEAERIELHGKAKDLEQETIDIAKTFIAKQ